MHEYESTRRVCYGSEDKDPGLAVFVPVCPRCGRYVKADAEIFIWKPEEPNATCKKCGRVSMYFEGYF
ncbi:MAG: hypothetical protein ACNS63_04225 [Candidatus Nitrospinota bacterium M3_3B_026]